MADTVQITEDFEFTDEDPLAQNEWITIVDTTGDPTELKPLDEMQVKSGLAQVTTTHAIAVKDPASTSDGVLPLSAEQEIRCSCFSYAHTASLTISGFIAGGLGSIITVAGGPLNRPIGSVITFTISLTTGFTPDANKEWTGSVLTSTQIEINQGFAPYGAFGSAIITLGDAFVSLFARLDANTSRVSATAFNPRGGYECQLLWSSTTAAAITLYKYMRGSVIRSTVTSGGVDATVVIPDANLNKPVMGALQDLRFTVTTEDIGVRLRVFLNDDDDASPLLSVLDISGLTPNSDFPKAAGTWGFGIGGGAMGIDTWEATDKFVIPAESTYQGRTLEQLRNATKDEISRGGNTNLTDAYLNAQINSAQQEVMVSIGQLALFTRREEVMTFSSTDEKTVEFPQTVEMITEIMYSPSRVPVAWRLEGYTETNSVRIVLGENPAANSYLVRYHKRWKDLLADTDRCIIPRMFDEVIVISAALRVAARSADARWEGSLVARYRAAMLRMRAYLNRLKTSEKNRVRVRSNRIFSRDSRYVDSPWQLYGLY